MANRRAWIFAETTKEYGTLHVMRAVALAQAAKIEGVADIHLMVNTEAGDLVKKFDLKEVDVQVLGDTSSRDSLRDHILKQVAPYTHPKDDTRHPKPLVFLITNNFDLDLQHELFKDGIELIMVQDGDTPTWADWCILPTPYASELDVPDKNGRTRMLRGAHFDMFRIKTIKNILKQRNHPTYAAHFAISTENLDAAKWLPLITKTIAAVEKPDFVTGEWAPKLTILPGPFCPSDDELKKLTGSTVPVDVHNNRFEYQDILMDVDMLFSADNTVMEEALALGTPRACLPRAGSSKDLMADHMQRRELSMRLEAFDSADFEPAFLKELQRLIFDPGNRRALTRNGQYVCDGLGAIRSIRQVVFTKYTDLQHVTRYFELGDPLIAKV